MQAAADFGVAYCAAAGVAITPSLATVVPSSTVVDANPSTVGEPSVTMIADATRDLIPAE